MHKIIYRNQCLDRLYIPRKEGWQGLQEINDVYRKTITNLDFYIKNTQEHHIQLVRKHHEEDLHENKSITKLAENFKKNHLQQLNDNNTGGQNNNTTEAPQEEEATTHSKHPYMHYEKIIKKRKWQTNKRAGFFLLRKPEKLHRYERQLSMDSKW